MKLALAAFVLVGAFANYSLACSCAAPPPPKEALKLATAVFTAKVEKVEKKGLEHIVTLKVLKSWKAVKEETVQINTPSDGAACGVEFEVKEEWLVYAFTDPDTKNLTTIICTRTTLVKGAEEELKELGKPIWEASSP